MFDKDASISWVTQVLSASPLRLNPLAGDASFRRYYRVLMEKNHPVPSYILMDASSEKENCAPFLNVASLMAKGGVKVPKIIANNGRSGWILMEDFGDRLFLDCVINGDPAIYYETALKTLLTIQNCPHVDNTVPVMDRQFIQTELERFEIWYVTKLLGYQISPQDRTLLDTFYDTLITTMENQPQVLVHRDYHSRNLMCLPDGRLGVLDFQDAMLGPATYDLVSLLRGAYIHWPDGEVQQWLQFFYGAWIKTMTDPPDFETFSFWFDMTGLQRHLKILGIFARLALRDNKKAYLEDLPRILTYTDAVTLHHPNGHAFGEWLRGIQV